MFHPSTAERMMAGAYTLMPVDSALDKRKTKAVKVLVFLSNLFSRYSYAVSIFSLLKMGIKVTQSTTMANGKPK
jgi:hypothetical protein